MSEWKVGNVKINHWSKNSNGASFYSWIWPKKKTVFTHVWPLTHARTHACSLARKQACVCGSLYLGHQTMPIVIFWLSVRERLNVCDLSVGQSITTVYERKIHALEGCFIGSTGTPQGMSRRRVSSMPLCCVPMKSSSSILSVMMTWMVRTMSKLLSLEEQ